MEITVSNQNGRVPVTIMHIDGNLDSASYNLFHTKADELIKEGTRHILVDFARSPFVSSAGFRALHQIFKQLNAIHPNANLSDKEMKNGITAGTLKSPYLKLVNLSKDTKKAFCRNRL